MRTPTAKGALRPTTLRAGGMLAMASAVLTLPMFLYSLQLEGRHDESALTMQLLLQGIGTFIFVALIATLRGFLVRNCAFKKAGAIILGLIILNLLYAAASSVLLFNPEAQEQLQPVLAALVILLGIAQAGLGMRLFALDNDLGGMKRPYCWLNIATGVCLASLLLIPLGIITSAVGDVMLATIFLREARRLSPPPEH
ncbi:MAG: hypothetical protein HYV06_10305 [Deltaproteobacteria bacterium]|nr:hypothetical protein [Deltaproteobacteria bacterium]